jgi:hypothetical protein
LGGKKFTTPGHPNRERFKSHNDQEIGTPRVKQARGNPRTADRSATPIYLSTAERAVRKGGDGDLLNPPPSTRTLTNFYLQAVSVTRGIKRPERSRGVKNVRQVSVRQVSWFSSKPPTTVGYRVGGRTCTTGWKPVVPRSRRP